MADDGYPKAYSALRQWGFTEIEIAERFSSGSPRIIYKVTADKEQYIIKGIPDSVPESVIKGNIAAHRHLGMRELAPCAVNLPDGRYYIRSDGYWFCLMDFIDGEPMKATTENEYILGQLAKRIHSIKDYDHPSGLNDDKSRFYDWFPDKPFKAEFDVLLNNLPDFGKIDRCFIHSDLGPHNVMLASNGRPVLIDLDDAGIGSRFLDLGWAFIMQFTEHDEEMRLSYRFDLAKAFLEGYYGADVPRSEYDLIWHGAVFMHISYMKCYGEDAVEPLWTILKYGIEQKEKLWDLLGKRRKDDL